jgi:hypothetical protein
MFLRTRARDIALASGLAILGQIELVGGARYDGRPVWPGPPGVVAVLVLLLLTMLTRGLSDPEIGSRLFVAETTVKTHVGRIFTKLGARDRVQAVIAAYDSGLVRPTTGSLAEGQ